MWILWIVRLYVNEEWRHHRIVRIYVFIYGDHNKSDTYKRINRHDVIKKATEGCYPVSDGRVPMFNMLFHINDERKAERPRHLFFYYFASFTMIFYDF